MNYTHGYNYMYHIYMYVHVVEIMCMSSRLLYCLLNVLHVYTYHYATAAGTALQ